MKTENATVLSAETARPTRGVDMKLELVVIPVADVDRAKRFYGSLGWRLDADYTSDDGYLQRVHFTPPGSGSSILFGKNVTTAAPGSAQGLYLIVSDIEAARKELIGRGVAVSEIFHGLPGVFTGTDAPYLFGNVRNSGAEPQRGSYRSFAAFTDPDGNGWLLQEVTQRQPGRVEADTTFTSTKDLAAALRRAEHAHGEHERRNGGQRDEDWPEWYAEYLVREQAGQELPL
jgi:catechol 2,3-dioxygenase-like lactoylglutathione lyase family enzyme